VFRGFPKLAREAVEADFEEAQWGFDIDPTRFVNYFVVGFALEVCRPQIRVVVVFVPAEAHDLVGPVNALNVSSLTRAPEHFDFRFRSRERFAEEQFYVDVRNHCSRTKFGGFVSDIVESGDVLQSLFEPTKAVAPGESPTTGKQEHHPYSYPSCGCVVVDSAVSDSASNVESERLRLIAS